MKIELTKKEAEDIHETLLWVVQEMYNSEDLDNIPAIEKLSSQLINNL